MFATDALSSSGLAFIDKNVGSYNKTVTANGVRVLDGNGGFNYSVTYVSNTNSTINPRALIVAAQTADKIYDGSTTASATLSDNRVHGDLLTLSLDPSLTGANFADKNAAIGKTVNVVGIQVAGTDAGNYTANTTAISRANVTPKTLTVVAAGQNKVYDGNTVGLLTLTTSGVVDGDNVQLAGRGTFADANAGTAKVVAVSNIIASGADARNYSLNNSSASTAADITPKIITVTASGTNKIYDGSTTDQVVLQSRGVLAQDLSAVDFSGTANFSSKNVGVGKVVAVTNVSASGSQSSNYQIANSTVLTNATITAKNITVAASGSEKVYDGSARDEVTLSSNGVISGDTVRFANTSAVFADKNVGDGKTVTVSGIGLSGTDAQNYTSNTRAITTANITPKGLTVLAAGINKVYDGGTTGAASLRSNEVVKGDNLRLTGSASFEDANAGTAKTVAVTDITATGTDARNYSLDNTSASTIASITPKLITVKAIGIDKNNARKTSAMGTLRRNGGWTQT